MAISSAPNQKIQSIKERINPPAPTNPRPFGLYSEETAKVIMRYILEHPDCTNSQIQDILGLSNPCVSTITKTLYDKGCIRRTKKGVTNILNFVKLPNTWDMEDVKNAHLNVIPKPVKESEPESSCKDDAKTDNTKLFNRYLVAETILESKWNIPYDSMAAYQKFIKDTSSFYGVKELDDLVAELHRFAKDRLSTAVLHCPVCNSVIKTEHSAVFCPTCQIRIDLGTSSKSIKAFIQFGKQLKGVA